MKINLEPMLRHPFATCMIIGTVFDSVTRLVGVIRGKDVEPMATISINSGKKEESNEKKDT